METLIPNAAAIFRPTSVDEFGRAARAEDNRVVQAGGEWWREIRPYFFRPVVPFRSLPGLISTIPSRARFGGIQYLVDDVQLANSTMSFLVFPAAQEYRLENMKHKRRHEIRAAAKKFCIRPITDAAVFKAHAHSVYLEFYERTRYQYLAARVAKSSFDQWVDIVFAGSANIVLGVYADDRLVAVNISRVVDDTLLYSSFFAKNEALAGNVPSLMLHAVREAAASVQYIREVYVGTPKTGAARSVDNFYLVRGCTIQTKPAYLGLHPISRTVLSWFFPGTLRRMRGEDTESAVASEADETRA